MARRARVRYRQRVASTVIVSDETIRKLIEAHASLAAWYYQMSEALRTAGASVATPTEGQRLAFVRQLATHFPELATVAESISSPRPYLPPPIVTAPAEVIENEGVATPPPPDGVVSTPAPPPMVDPSKVKYEE